MQTFDGAIFKLYMSGRISFDDAIANADSPNNLRLRIKLATNNVEAADLPKPPVASSFAELSLAKIEDEKEG